MEMIRFSLAPGRYRLMITAQDSVSGHKAESAVDLSGFSSTPSASDLLLSPQIRLATPTDTEPRPAELRWGRMLVTAAAELELTPLRAEAYYLLEAYSKQDASGTLTVRVADTTGKVMVRATPVPVTVPAGGGVLQGRLSLAGLPPARYEMTASLKLGQDSVVERSAGFVMAGLSETLERDVARREASKVTDQGYFAEMNDAQLNQAKDPLMIIAESGELSSWDKLSASMPSGTFSRGSGHAEIRLLIRPRTRRGRSFTRKWTLQTGPIVVRAVTRKAGGPIGANLSPQWTARRRAAARRRRAPADGCRVERCPTKCGTSPPRARIGSTSSSIARVGRLQPGSHERCSGGQARRLERVLREGRPRRHSTLSRSRCFPGYSRVLGTFHPPFATRCAV